MLEDIAILTGGNVISEELGRKLDSVELEDLGRARQVRASKEETTIVDGFGDKAEIAARAEIIKNKSLKLLPISIKKNYKNVLLNYLVA